MQTLNVEIVTPEKLFYSAPAGMATIPGEEGYMGVLPQHAPLISNLQPGIVTLEADNEEKRYFVAEGVAEVSAERCTILTKKALDVTVLTASEVDAMIAEKESLLSQSYKEEEIQEIEEEIAFFKKLSHVLAQS